jgi:sugar fermentation stimulation protein A
MKQPTVQVARPATAIRWAAVQLVIQRSDGSSFSPAADIDPDYAAALKSAVDTGVEALAYRANVAPACTTLVQGARVGL